MNWLGVARVALDHHAVSGSAEPLEWHIVICARGVRLRVIALFFRVRSVSDALPLYFAICLTTLSGLLSLHRLVRLVRFFVFLRPLGSCFLLLCLSGASAFRSASLPFPALFRLLLRSSLVALCPRLSSCLCCPFAFSIAFSWLFRSLLSVRRWLLPSRLLLFPAPSLILASVVAGFSCFVSFVLCPPFLCVPQDVCCNTAPTWQGGPLARPRCIPPARGASRHRAGSAPFKRIVV